MGMFNEIRMHCTDCEKPHYLQSKKGDCVSTYTIPNIPYELMEDVNGYEWQCERCERWNEVWVSANVTVN